MQNAFMQIGNALMEAVLRSPLHWAISNETLLVTVIGHKSGCEYALLVNYVRDGDILFIQLSNLGSTSVLLNLPE